MTAKEPSARIEIHVVDNEVPIDGTAPQFEYSAIDNAGRTLATKRYDKCTVWNSIEFVDYLIKHSRHGIHSIHTDHGREFNGKFAEHLVKLNIRHDLIAPYKS
jgi:hypothetical protein